MSIPSPTEYPEGFADKKRSFYQQLSLRHKTMLRPHWEEGQILGSKSNAEIWRNVTEHCLVAGSLAQLLAEEMGLQPDQVTSVTHAAILHDWYKKHETIARRQAQTHESIRDIVTEVKKNDLQKLAKRGFPPHVIRLTGANIPETAAGPQTDEEKIIWYIDAMLHDTTPVPINERMDRADNHPTRGAEYRAFSESYIPVYGKPLHDLQRDLGQTVGAYIADRIGYCDDVHRLPFHLKQLLIEKIMASA